MMYKIIEQFTKKFETHLSTKGYFNLLCPSDVEEILVNNDFKAAHIMNETNDFNYKITKLVNEYNNLIIKYIKKENR